MSDFTHKKIKEKSILGHNIQFLRKRMNISQEELAKLLGIKRSNVAAYESKNVEPRLSVIIEMAKLFDIRLQNFIESKLVDIDYPKNSQIGKKASGILSFDSNKDVQEFADKSTKIRRVLEGFKAFYRFKKENLDDSFPNKGKLLFDIDNFLQLMEHLLNFNETVINAIDNNDHSQNESKGSTSSN